MAKKIILTILALCVLVSEIPPSYASETEYAITSGLNGGWRQDGVEKELVAWANLSDEAECHGMSVEIGDDPESKTVSRLLGREGWVISPNKGENARYINIDVDSSVAYDVTDGRSYAIEVDYYDEGISSLAMEYETMDYQPIILTQPAGNTSQPELNVESPTAEGEYLVFNNTKVWRSYRWFLPNPRFTGKVDGFDMRVGIYSDTMKYSRGGEVVVSAVRLYRLNTYSRVEVSAAEQQNIGNIFFDGEAVVINTRFSSCIYPHQTQIDGSYPLDIVYTARDEDGKVVYRGYDSFVLEPLTEAERQVSFTVEKYGIYRLDIEAFCLEKNIYSMMGTEFSYVRSSKGEIVNPKVGIQIGLTNPEDTEVSKLTGYAGIPNVRMMLYYYNYRKSAEMYEPTNVAVPEGYKSLFRAFKSAGLEIDANLHSASWMGAAYNFSEIERTPPYTEAGLRRWAEYCAMMAELFGDTVDQFEIWNEYNLGPNHSFNMENRPAEDYGKMYEVSKAAIKAVNPDIPVIAFNTSGAAPAWIERVLASGLRDIDIASIHPYQWYGDPLTYNAVKKGIEPVTEVFKKYGLEDVPLWITEYGYSTHYEDVNTDLEQGMYNVQAYSLIMATEKIDRYYIYCMLDKANNMRADRETNFGLIRDRINNPIPYMTPYAAKPGYLAVSQMNLMYHDAEFVSMIELGNTGAVIRNRHTTDGSQFAVMFSNKEDGELVTLNLGTDKITVYDAYGNSSEVYGENGIYSFDLSKRVMYIEGDFKCFEQTAGGVFPSKTGIDAVYGEEARIPIANYSNRKIYAEASPMEGSEVTGGSCEISGEYGELRLKGGNALGGTERVRLVLRDDEKVYFNGCVYLNYKESVSLSTVLVPDSKGWVMRCSLKNMSDKSAVSGRLTVLTPKEWQKTIADTALIMEPGGERSVDIRLPVAMTADDKVIEIGFVIDESSGIGSYVSRNYNFSAAQETKTPIIIDGRDDEWTDGFMTLNRNDQFVSLLSLGSTYQGPDDLSVKAAIKWDDENFYFFADVLDNVHFAKNVEPIYIWQMDSIQLALVYDPENVLERTEFEEIAICDLNGEPTLYRHKTRFKGDKDYTKVEGSELATVRSGLHTYYELKIPWSSLMVEKVEIRPGTELKFAMVVNENDGVGRVGYMAFGDGIVSSKNSNLFKRLYIRSAD